MKKKISIPHDYKIGLNFKSDIDEIMDLSVDVNNLIKVTQEYACTNYLSKVLFRT